MIFNEIEFIIMHDALIAWSNDLSINGYSQKADECLELAKKLAILIKEEE